MIKSLKDIKTLGRKTKILIGAGLALLIVVGWQVVERLAGGTQAGGPRAGTVAVEIAPIVEGSIRDLGIFSGTLIPKSYFTVVPKISGRIKALYVDIGDRLARNQLVALLEDEEYQQAVIQAEADLAVAKANIEEAQSALDLARKELERSESLYRKGILSNAQIDTARALANAQDSKYKVAAAQLSNREAALEGARVRLSYTRIRASWETDAGGRYVGERFVNAGAMVSSNAPILSVIELQPITAVIHVTEKDYFRLKPEQHVGLTSGAFPGAEFRGRVARIAPLLKETSREARVEVEIENPDRVLKPGMFINARIEFASRPAARIVPYSAVVTRAGRQGVFLADLEAKKAVFLPVTLGIIEGERAEILEPARASGHVVTLGHHLLEDGTALILPANAPSGVVPASKDAPGAGR
jgi:RND family efflux transporter MFP subunit